MNHLRIGAKLMKMSPGHAIVRREGSHPLDLSRLMRVALVVYLSPVILLVFAIGLIGMLAASLVKPAGQVAAKGVHSDREPALTASARETV
jgi:hypothetical protein